MRRRAVNCVLCLLGALLAAEAAAWPSALMSALGRDARRLLPRSLSRLLAEREEQILEEVGRFPPELGQELASDLAAGQLRPQTLGALDTHLSVGVELLRNRRVSEGIVRLGAALRIPADLSDPVLTVGPQAYPSGVAREYYAFLEGNLAKIPVVLDDAAALQLERRDLPGYWQAVLERSRRQSPVVGIELFRDGRVVDHSLLDYRSPVFAVASLAYSRAVTAIAATWLALWREAHGDLTRMPAPREIRPRDQAPPGRLPSPSSSEVPRP